MGFFFFLTSCGGGGGGGVPSFSLNVSLNGNGTVTSNPAGINCTTGNQGTCQKTFREGTQVTLAANPATGWRFDSWGGDPDCTDGQVTMNATKTCTATFVQITWAKTYGGESRDRARSIQQTSDGGYIVAGYTGSFGAGSYDSWVLKLDVSGDVVWQKTYGGKEWDEASSIQQTSDGGYITAGASGDFAAGTRFWVVKLDATGDVQWQKTFGPATPDGPAPIQQTSDGGYIVANWNYFAGPEGWDAWVLKLDASGNVANCLPPALFRDSVSTSASTSVAASNSTATPTTSSATVTSTNVVGQDSCVTTVTHCTGSL